MENALNADIARISSVCEDSTIDVILHLSSGAEAVKLDRTNAVGVSIQECLGLSPFFSVWFGGEPVEAGMSFEDQGIESGARLSVVVDEATWRDKGYRAARIERKKIPTGRSGELRLTNSSFTIETWVKVNKFSSKTGDAWYDDNAIFGTADYGNGVGLHCIVRAHCARFDFYCNGIAGSTPIPLREWSHIAFVYDIAEQSQAIIVNGELDTQEGGHAPLQGNARLDIGSWAGGRYLDGDIAEFRIWNVARSLEEIRDAMHKPYDALDDIRGLRKAYSFLESGGMLDHVAGSEARCPVEVVGLESPFRGT